MVLRLLMVVVVLLLVLLLVLVPVLRRIYCEAHRVERVLTVVSHEVAALAHVQRAKLGSRDVRLSVCRCWSRDCSGSSSSTSHGAATHNDNAPARGSR